MNSHCTILTDSPKRGVNPTNTQVTLEVLSRVSVSDLLRAARHTETMQLDSTWGTNNDGFKLNFQLGADANNKTTTYAKTFLRGETAVNFMIAFALRMIYGPLLDIVAVVALDGNKECLGAIVNNIARNMIGRTGLTKIQRCYYHAVNQTYVTEYGLHAGSLSLEPLDGGISEMALKWVVRIVPFYRHSVELIDI